MGDAATALQAQDDSWPPGEKSGDGHENDIKGAVPTVVDRNTFHAATNSALAASWRVSIDPYLFRAFGGMVRRVGHALAGWATIPNLPYAALWEASEVARLATEPDYMNRDAM